MNNRSAFRCSLPGDMKSHYRSLQRHESPARVFAYLKAKAERMKISMNEMTEKGTHMSCTVEENRGATFNLPTEESNLWISDKPPEKPSYDFHQDEFKALTISPIKSPRKSLNKPFPEFSQHLKKSPPRKEENNPVKTRHACTLTNRCNGTPKKRMPIPLMSTEDGCRWNAKVLDAYVPREKCPLVSPSKMYDTVKERGRKRKGQWQELDKDSICTTEAWDGGENVAQECLITADTAPFMSPAKVFAYLKERETKRQQQQEIHKVSSSTGKLEIEGHSCQSIDMPTIGTLDMAKSENDTCSEDYGCVPVPAFPDNQCRLEAADSLSARDPADDTRLPAIQPQVALMDDPLVINSPRISVPKKCKATFKHKAESEATHRVVPKGTVIYLMNWMLKSNEYGLFVDGHHKDENISWHTNIIVERVTSKLVKTLSGSSYTLVGRMKMNSELPKWFLKKFVHGFPINWKMYYDKFLAESRNMEAESTNTGRGTANWTVPVKRTFKHSVLPSRPKASKTPASCPAKTSPSLSGAMKLSRSGRIIKAPLEYWKGGRVILDTYMNVTIHDSYDTTICLPKNNTPLTRRASQIQRTTGGVFLPSNAGQRWVKVMSDSDKSSVPLRKVKAPQRKCKNVKTKPRLSCSEDELPKEPTNDNNNGPDKWTISTRRSRRRHQVGETALYAESLPPSQIQPKRHSKKSNSESSPCNTDSSAGVSDESPSSSADSGRVLRERDTSRSSKVDNCKRSPQRTASPKRNKGHKNGSKAKKSKNTNLVIPQEKNEDEWTEAELTRLQEAVNSCSKYKVNYWVNVALIVGTRSAEECQKRHTSRETSQVSTERSKKSKKKEPTNKPALELPKITARVGTLKRKEQVRQLLEAMPKEDFEDAFTCPSMKRNRLEIDCTSPSGKDCGFWFSEKEPLTPGNADFPAVKTPQCLHISPGMMGSVNRKNDDKYVYQLQRRMKRSQVNGYKRGPSSKICSEIPKDVGLTLTPSRKREMERCGQTAATDSFIVWKMFPDNDGTANESDEEEDLYFSEDN